MGQGVNKGGFTLCTVGAGSNKGLRCRLHGRLPETSAQESKGVTQSRIAPSSQCFHSSRASLTASSSVLQTSLLHSAGVQEKAKEREVRAVRAATELRPE